LRHELDKRLDYGVPQLGFRGRDGRFFENQEIVPDVPIAAEPAALTAGRDPQLERGVEVLMKQIGRVRSAAGPSVRR
jgi:tricorn protease